MFQWFSTIFSLGAPGSRSASALPKPGLSNEIMMRTTMTLMMMIIVMMIMDPHVFSCVFHSFFQVSGIGARDLWGTLRNNSQIKLQKQDNMIPPDVKVMVLSYGRGE